MGIFLLLYNIALIIGVGLGFPLLLLWFAFSPKTRAGFRQKLGLYDEALIAQMRALPNDSGATRKRVWIHAVSVGEFNAIRPLVSELQSRYTVIISTTTKTSQELAKRVFPDTPLFYYPYDFRPCVKRALSLVRPDLVLITETELWPNFMEIATRQREVPLFVINGRISRGSYNRYRYIRPLLAAALRQARHFYMQTQGDADRIKKLADLPHEVVTVTGNLKFDINPVIDPVQRQRLSHLLGFEENDTVLVFASTHTGEDEPFLALYNRLRKDFPRLKAVLAPRHPERLNEVKTILSNKSLGYSIRSQLSESAPNTQPIVVLNTIGELLIIYSLADVAVIGGSFIERGGQNALEPISQRIPVIFGPDMSNFAAISRMIVENNAGYQVKTVEDIDGVLTELLTQPEICDNIVENGQQLIENNRGAKEILMAAIDGVLTLEERVGV